MIVLCPSGLIAAFQDVMSSRFVSSPQIQSLTWQGFEIPSQPRSQPSVLHTPFFSKQWLDFYTTTQDPLLLLNVKCSPHLATIWEQHFGSRGTFVMGNMAVDGGHEAVGHWWLQFDPALNSVLCFLNCEQPPHHGKPYDALDFVMEQPPETVNQIHLSSAKRHPAMVM